MGREKIELNQIDFTDANKRQGALNDFTDAQTAAVGEILTVDASGNASFESIYINIDGGSASSIYDVTLLNIDGGNA